jgi:hypothetical protein
MAYPDAGMRHLASSYLFSLLLTYAVEIPLLVYLLHPYASWRRSLVTAIACSGLTHPLLWFGWPRVVPLDHYPLFLATGESLVVLAEAALIWGIALRQERRAGGTAMLASIATNAASCAAGLALRALASLA